MKPTTNLSLQTGRALRVRTGLQAGGFRACMGYCENERTRCYQTPGMPAATCDDRYPVCQNACSVCGSSLF